MTEFYYNWKNLDTDIRLLSSKVKDDGFKPQYIIGISRGGLVPATMLSYKFNVPLLVFDPKKDEINNLKCCFERNSILVVDEINDTGSTINSIRKSIIKNLKGEYREGWENIFELNNIKFLTLYNNLSSNAKVNYFTKLIDKESNPNLWIQFPWE